MRLLVTGTNGQVARALVARAKHYPDIAVIAVGRPHLDLEDTATVLPAISQARPDLIVNAAAYTAVDQAETDVERAFSVNRDGAGAVASAAHALGVPHIHLSTDYVFSGDKPSAYVESDNTGPLGAYGRSKLAGELAVRTANARSIILRTSWVYSPFGSNFVKTVLRLAIERPQLKIVDDQIGNPTSALDLADTILRISNEVTGSGSRNYLFHIAGRGDASWCDVARHTLDISRSMGGPFADVQPIATSEYPTPARRPLNSRLNTEKFSRRFGFSTREWRLGVADTVQSLLSSRS